MNQTYQVLAGIALGHNYYADGKCKDVELIASSETQSSLRKLRLMWGSLQKRQSNEYRLMQTFVGGNPLIEIPDGTVLSFYLKATVSDFAGFTTGLDTLPGEIIRWHNDAAGDVVNEKLPIFGNSVAFGGVPVGVEVTATAPDGSVVKEFSHDRDGSGFLTMDLSMEPSGKYLFTWAGGSLAAYKDANLLSGAYLGVLDLQQTATISFNHQFELNFQAQESIWKYCFFVKGTLPNILTNPDTIKVVTEPVSGGSGPEYFSTYTILSSDIDLDELDELKGPDRFIYAQYSYGYSFPVSEIPRTVEIHHYPDWPALTNMVKLHQFFPNPKRGDPNALVFVSLDRTKV